MSEPVTVTGYQCPVCGEIDLYENTYCSGPYEERHRPRLMAEIKLRDVRALDPLCPECKEPLIQSKSTRAVHCPGCHHTYLLAQAD